MRIPAGVVLATALVLWGAVASADTYYKYRDRRTGRDVYVNRLEQVPQQYRSQAKIVLETPDTATEPEAEGVVARVAPAAPPAPAAAPAPKPAPLSREELRRVLSTKSILRDGPELAGATIDMKLSAAGARTLTGGERNDLALLLWTIGVAALVSGLAALAAWIVILVTAVRDGRLWWAFFIFLFWPLGYLYLFIHGGRGRALWKTLCALAMAAPVVVGVVGAWRFHVWLVAVLQARGLHG
jgi:hypothetical protein